MGAHPRLRATQRGASVRARRTAMAVTASALSESYYPADQSEPVLDTTVGGILRDAAQAVPDQPALIGGHPDPAERRRWTYGELLDDAERCARASRTLRA